MTDYQKIIDDIQTVLCADADPTPQALTALETMYVAAVEEVNVRLKQCDALLHKGHRTEALQLCDIEPKLMDVVGILDFAEREQWAEYVKQFNLPGPPELLIDVAADINEAYNVQEPVQKLLRLHRLYGLGRMPLNHRIDVMRKISVLDKGNPIWTEDLKTFEKARHDQLRDQVALAIKNEDIATITILEKELRESPWLVPPAKSVVDKATQGHTRMRVAQARVDMQHLEKELTAAHSSLDPDKARVLRNRWNKLAAIADLPPEDPLAELVAPALDWLENEDCKQAEQSQYEQAIAALTRALDDGEPQLELERIYRIITQHGRELPKVLEQRLAERLRYLAECDARRSKLIIFGVVSAILLVAGLTGVAIVLQMQSRQLAATVTSLEQFIKDDNLESANTFLADLEKSAPRIFADPQIRKLQGDLDSLKSTEEGRKLLWQQELEAAKSAIENLTLDSFPVASENLKRIRDLSKTDEERSEVKKLDRQARAKQAAMQAAVNEEFLEKLTPFKNRVEAVKSGDIDEIIQLQQEGVALKQQLHVTREIIVQVDPLLKKLEVMQANDEKFKREKDLVDRITKAVGNPAGFRMGLESYTTEFPNTRRANDFQRVLKKELDASKGTDAWDQFLRKWSMIDLSRIEPKQVEPLLKQATELVDKHRDDPAAVNLDSLISYLNAVGRRIDQNGASLVAKLNEPLNNPTVTGLYMALELASDGKKRHKRYYMPDVPRMSNGSWEIRYFKNLTLNKKGVKLIPANAIVMGGKPDWTAPQSAFSHMALPLLDKISSNWDATFVKLLTELHEDKRMDPLLRVQLISLFLDVARQGSLPLETAFTKHVELINSAQLDPAINWIDPDDADANKERKKAEDVLNRMEGFGAATPVADKFVAELAKSLSRVEHQWIGWLHRDREDTWDCDLTERNKAERQKSSGDLLIIEVPSDGSSNRFVKIGDLREGKVKLQPGQSAGFVEGRPVYLMRTN